MAGAIFVTESQRFSCSTRAFEVIVRYLESELAGDPIRDVLHDGVLFVGVVSVIDLPVADAIRFVEALAAVADQIEQTADPPEWWTYPHHVWRGLRSFMFEVKAFATRARAELDRVGEEGATS